MYPPVPIVLTPLIYKVLNITLTVCVDFQVKQKIMARQQLRRDTMPFCSELY